MKKCAFALAIPFLLILTMTAQAAEIRSIRVKPDLYFNETTATCSVSVKADSASKLYPIKWTHKEKRIPSSGHVERQCVPWKWTHQQIGNP